METDNPRAVEHFLLEVFQPLLLATPAVPTARAHYCHLAGLPRLVNLLGAQLVYHVGVAMHTPRLFLPSEVLALPDDLQELRQLPLDVAFLNRTEGEEPLPLLKLCGKTGSIFVEVCPSPWSLSLIIDNIFPQS